MIKSIITEGYFRNFNKTILHFNKAMEVYSNKPLLKVVFSKIFEPIKPGDVPATYASTDRLQAAIGFKPQTSIEEGLQHFANWYVNYYKLS